jgi:hypothetical protein
MKTNGQKLEGKSSKGGAERLSGFNFELPGKQWFAGVARVR